jgi:hypothetical protein
LMLLNKHRWRRKYEKVGFIPCKTIDDPTKSLINPLYVKARD